MYKAQLWELMGMDGHAWFELDGKRYILHSVERETPNGYSFNLQVSDENNKYFTIYIRTLD